MKNSISIFVLMLLISLACNKEETPTCENCSFDCLDRNETDVITNDCIENWECSFKLFPDSEVDLAQTEGVTSGDKLVFQLINSTQGSEAIADDEFTHILVFELNESQESFSVEAEDLENMNVHFRRICFCTDTDFIAASDGCLQGEKQADGSWFVQGHLTIPYPSNDRTLKFDALFVN